MNVSGAGGTVIDRVGVQWWSAGYFQCISHALIIVRAENSPGPRLDQGTRARGGTVRVQSLTVYSFNRYLLHGSVDPGSRDPDTFHIVQMEAKSEEQKTKRSCSDPKEFRIGPFVSAAVLT